MLFALPPGKHLVASQGNYTDFDDRAEALRQRMYVSAHRGVRSYLDARAS
jgi:hypothetical protein